MVYRSAVSVVSVKVPREVKVKMDSLKNVVDWPKEIREFIVMKIEEFERIRNVEVVENILKDMPKQPKGSISRLVREDREGH
ncbi:MAG: CopG family transcriptional regulator [Candidatus Bathyarchaeia archaeon]|nr:CopG family transcriptional regulator [Candidatus Bathyarchaeota archaeon]